MNVLIVEDQRRLADALNTILTDTGCHVDAVYDGQSGLDYALLGDYDVMILDVMLPLLNGFEVVTQLHRAKKQVPVLMLTARDTLRDKVTGLDCGADDYLTKPFQAAELLARLRALTRRKGEIQLETLIMGNTTLDLQTAELSSPSGSVHLSLKEFEVCRMLMSDREQVLSKQTLLSRIWGLESDTDENNVEAYVSFLRKKLAFIRSDVAVVTLRMLGYRMEVDARQAGCRADDKADCLVTEG
ncbi:MAG: response regulator transcription factor [Coriobacteriaceae bacterium]|nr:response regulator transcription factor [Coriobacteriaceae bacterium]